MNVAIPSELRAFVESKVAAGEYGSIDEVVAQALVLLRHAEQSRYLKLESLRREIQIGLDQIERGEFIECDDESLKELFDDIKRRGRQRLEAGQGSTVTRSRWE